MTHIILADASNDFAGQWLYLVGSIVTQIVIAGVMVLSFFATKREMDQLSDQVRELTEALAEQSNISEDRAVKIHNRLNPIGERLGTMEGKVQAFEMSFEKFTRIIESTSRQSNETINAFTRSLDTFASVISERNHHR